MGIDLWKKNFTLSEDLYHQLLSDEDFLSRCESFVRLLVESFSKNKTVYIAGNGGSHCQGLHFAEELTGRFRKNRRPLGALALGEATHLTCVGNDYGFDHIFSRQLEALAREGDVFLALSTSGESKNILEALQLAKKRGLKTVALLGKDGGAAKKSSDLSIVVPSQSTDLIQEIHLKIIHSSIEFCERELFPENY